MLSLDDILSEGTSVSSGFVMREQIITASTTWVRPAKMVGDTVWVTMIGGGQAGREAVSNGSAGGSGGDYVIRHPVEITGAQSVACTIGLGGITSGQAGGPTSFGSYVSVLGGSNTVGTPGSGSSHQAYIAGMDTPLGFGGVMTSVNLYQRAGGGGLILGKLSECKGTALGNIHPALGYGCGGTAYGGDYRTFTRGLDGAIKIEWPERL